MQTLVPNNEFLDKKVKTQPQQNKKSNIKTLAGAGNWTQSECFTTAPPSQLRVTIVVKPFNCFDAMGRNVNKQSQICGPDIFNKYIFSVIFLNAWITVFGIFFYYIPINDLYTIQANKYNRPDWTSCIMLPSCVTD